MKKNPGPDDFIVEIYWTFKEELMAVLHKGFEKIERREHFPTHFMRLLLPQYQHQKNIWREKKR